MTSINLQQLQPYLRWISKLTIESHWIKTIYPRNKSFLQVWYTNLNSSHTCWHLSWAPNIQIFPNTLLLIMGTPYFGGLYLGNYGVQRPGSHARSGGRQSTAATETLGPRPHTVCAWQPWRHCYGYVPIVTNLGVVKNHIFWMCLPKCKWKKCPHRYGI